MLADIHIYAACIHLVVVSSDPSSVVIHHWIDTGRIFYSLTIIFIDIREKVFYN